MTANTNLRIAETDFDQIRINLINFLRNQSEFTDYDFDGSGLSVLIDLLTYNTHYMAYYLNMIGNEMFLDSALLRPSVISHLKEINYVPSSQKSSTSLVNILVTPSALENQTAQTLTLPRFTNFQAQAVDGINYNFTAINSNTSIKNANGSFLFSNVTLQQGDVLTNSFLISGNQNRFSLPSANVDTNYVYVSVQQSSTNTFITTYNEAQDLTEITANSTVYFLEEDPDPNGTYTISFGDGVLGLPPPNGSIVLVTYLDTSGKYANKANSYILLNSINGYNDNVIITPVITSAGGADRESIETAKFRGPIHYTTQNRAVTVNDYKSILMKDYPNVDAVAVWGGADNDPPVYGKVFISLKPVDDYEISIEQKNIIIQDIISNRSVLTVTPEIVDPDYSFLQLKLSVNYDPNKTTLDEGQLQDLIVQTIQNYRNSDLHTFESVFRKSKLQTLIDQTENSITSSSIKVFLQKRVLFVLNTTQNYSMNFLTPLNHSEFPDQPYSYPGVFVNDLSGISRTVFYEVTPSSETGIDSVSVVTPGAGYTSIPVVTITGDGTGATATAHIINGQVVSVNITNSGVNYTRATVAITGGGSGSGATGTAILSDSLGVIRSFYYLSNGQKQILNSTVGTINFNTGAITFNSVLPIGVVPNVNYATNVFTFSAQPEEDTIFPVRNQILDIDFNDSSSIIINMVAET